MIMFENIKGTLWAPFRTTKKMPLKVDIRKAQEMSRTFGDTTESLFGHLGDVEER